MRLLSARLSIGSLYMTVSSSTLKPGRHPDISQTVGTNQLIPPIFIMGCARSGTSLLAEILNNHSRISIYFESHYYPLFRSELPYYGDLKESSNLRFFLGDVLTTLTENSHNRPTPEEVQAVMKDCTFEAILSAILHVFAVKSGKVRSGDKTPRHFAYLDEIIENFPSSPVIFIVRDPRDTVASLRKAFNTSIRGGCQQWNDAISNYRRFKNRVHLVRYESLVLAPEETMRSICAYLNEPFEEGLFEFFQKSGPRNGNHHDKLFKPIDSSSIGNYRSMSEDDIRQVELRCSTGMRESGYNMDFVEQTATPLPYQKAYHCQKFIERLRYYSKPYRLQRGFLRWTIAARVRARYWLFLKPSLDSASR